MRVKVHVEGIKGSGIVKPGEEPQVMFNGVLEVDGVLIDEVGTIEVVFKGGDFATVKPHLVPGSFEVVSHTDESWPELISQIDEQRKVKDGAARVIAERE